MLGFMPGIHVLLPLYAKGVDGRNKSGHDEEQQSAMTRTRKIRP
jgi:hypothetical protein